MMKIDRVQTLNTHIPTTLQTKYTIVPDQITGTVYALAEINKDHSSNYLAHTPKTNFMTFEQMKFFLLGMQEFIRLQNLKQI